MTAPVLIFAVGNESRGDDALGPLLLRQLDSWLKQTRQADGFELIEDFQLQIEHALDMQDRRLVLFIDAGMDTPAPFAFYRASIGNEPVLYSHALQPQALLKVYEQCYRVAAPDAFILSIRGISFELGEPLSPDAASHLASALGFIQPCLLEPRSERWDARCTEYSRP